VSRQTAIARVGDCGNEPDTYNSKQKEEGAISLIGYRLLLLTSVVTWGVCCAAAVGSEVIDDCDEVGQWRPLSGRPTPEVARVSVGRNGGALRISFHESKESQFAGRGVTADEGWSRAAGLSFWMKGDGSDGFVAVTVLDETLTRRHAALLSLRPREWQRVRLRWEDFVPETMAIDWFRSPTARMKPSQIRAIWFGRWFYLRPWQACSFEVDDLRLEERIDAKPSLTPPASGIPRTMAKLKAKQKVSITALGDSITSGYRLKNPEREAWPAVLEKGLRKEFDYKDVEVRNRGIAGIETRQSIALLPRDIGVAPPDLAIAHFGYNDLTAMEERRIPRLLRRQIASRNFVELVKRIRQVSDDKTEVLLIATVPGGNRARRSALDFIGEEAQRVATELKCGFTDLPRQTFQTILEKKGPKELFAKMPDGSQDVSHPHKDGQKVFAEALLKVFSVR